VANIKQQKKRIRRSEAQRQRNLHYRSRIRTLFRRVEEAVEQSDAEATTARSGELEQLIDRAAARNVIHRNNAARKKSRLARLTADEPAGDASA
jgi:small subunit ribosomal protein S20